MGEPFNKFLGKGIFFFLFFVSYISYSQFYHGLVTGVNLNNTDFRINESAEPSSALGFNVGYVAERELSENLYVRLGFEFNRREFKAISRRGINTTNEKWGIDNVEIPINFGYYLNWNNRNFQFFVDAGINIGYNMRAIIENDEETIRLDIGNEEDINRIAMGANVGVGLLIKKRIKVRFNYYNGLSNIVNSEGNTWKSKTFGLSINYFLREKEVY